MHFAARAFVNVSSRGYRLVRHRLGGFGDHVLGHGVSLRQQGIELVRVDGIDFQVEPLRLGEKVRVLGRALEGRGQRRLAIRRNPGGAANGRAIACPISINFRI